MEKLPATAGRPLFRCGKGVLLLWKPLEGIPQLLVSQLIDLEVLEPMGEFAMALREVLQLFQFFLQLLQGGLLRGSVLGLGQIVLQRLQSG